jgi:hypothetical protein
MWQQLILIVIEGHHDDVTEYLTRARTVCIDVDAAGRKVRARRHSDGSRRAEAQVVLPDKHDLCMLPATAGGPRSVGSA